MDSPFEHRCEPREFEGVGEHGRLHVCVNEVPTFSLLWHPLVRPRGPGSSFGSSSNPVRRSLPWSPNVHDVSGTVREVTVGPSDDVSCGDGSFVQVRVEIGTPRVFSKCPFFPRKGGVSGRLSLLVLYREGPGGSMETSRTAYRPSSPRPGGLPPTGARSPPRGRVTSRQVS